MAKHHLPLLPAGKSEDTEPPRPPWQWVGFGATAIVAVWLPLSALAWALAARTLDRTGDAAALRGAALRAMVLYAFALSLGALAGGYLVGHWGPARVGVRHAVLLAVMAPTLAALGGWLGLRGRRAGSSW